MEEIDRPAGLTTYLQDSSINSDKKKIEPSLLQINRPNETKKSAFSVVDISCIWCDNL